MSGCAFKSTTLGSCSPLAVSVLLLYLIIIHETLSYITSKSDVYLFYSPDLRVHAELACFNGAFIVYDETHLRNM